MDNVFHLHLGQEDSLNRVRFVTFIDCEADQSLELVRLVERETTIFSEAEVGGYIDKW